MKAAFIKMKKNPLYVLYSGISDILFIILYYFIVSSLAEKALEYIVAVSSLTARESPGLGSIIASSQSLLQAILSVEGVRPFMSDLLIMGVIYLAVIFILYSFFQGISWYYAKRISGSKIKYFDFMTGFLKINAVWLIFFLIFSILRFIISFYNMISGRIYSGGTAGFGIMGIIAAVLGIVILYFAVNSYTAADKTKSIKARMKAGLSGPREKILVFIVVMIVILIVHALQVLIFRTTIPISPVFSGIFFILIEIPVLTYARVVLLGGRLKLQAK